MGAGHVMRCLALAQAWQDASGEAVFLMNAGAPELEARLESEGMEVVHLSQQPGRKDDGFETAKLAQKTGAQWVVADGYEFGTAYQKIIKERGCNLLLMDDTGDAGPYVADIILNQNMHAEESLYRDRDPHTKLFLGPRYVLLRREFLKWRGFKRAVADKARKVLVTLGGGDAGNVTLRIMQALERVKVEGLEATVVAGPTNPHWDALRSAAESSRVAIHLERHPRNMAELMAWADVAVSAMGSTAWELLFMGVPFVGMSVADNQRPVMRRLGQMGLAATLDLTLGLTSHDIAAAVKQLVTDEQKRRVMERRGRELVDGKGAERVCAAMTEAGA